MKHRIPFVALGLSVAFAGCGSDGSAGSSVGQSTTPKAKTFHDATFLARDIKKTVKSRLADDPDTAGMTVESLDCIAKNEAKTDFTCLALIGGPGTEELSESERSSTTDVTVAADGGSYITK